MRHRCGLPCNHRQIFSTLSPFKAVGVCNFVPRWTFTHSRLLGDDAASGTHSCEEVECPMAALEPWLPHKFSFAKSKGSTVWRNQGIVPGVRRPKSVHKVQILKPDLGPGLLLPAN